MNGETNIDHEDWKLAAGAYNPFPDEMTLEEQAAYERWIEESEAHFAYREQMIETGEI